MLQDNGNNLRSKKIKKIFISKFATAKILIAKVQHRKFTKYKKFQWKKFRWKKFYMIREKSQKFKSILSLVIKTKLVQNVNRMSENIVSTCQYVDMSECNFST